MNDTYNARVLDLLKSSEFWVDDKTRISGNTIQGLVCPACGSKTAWAYSNGISAICCNRLSKCGARTKTSELFDLKQDIEKEFPATKKDPKRPATEYLKSRGLKDSLVGLEYAFWPNVRNSGSGAVMLPVGEDKKGKKVSNGRLLNPKSGEGKTHNSGSTSGLFWQHPGRKYDVYKPVYVVEGPIDGASLVELGHQAIAVISSGQDPSKLQISQFRKLILFFDNDEAGTRATKKWKALIPDIEALLPDPGNDANGILCSGPLEQAKQQFIESQDRYRVNANLALAESAHEYATTYLNFFKYVPGLFIFNGCTYFSSLKTKGDESYVMVERCGKFTMHVISYLLDTSAGDPEYKYYLEITPQKGRAVHSTATGRDLATPRGIKEFLLSRAKVSFEAGAQAATAIATHITESKAPEVKQLSIQGYDPTSKCYIFKDFLIDPTGKHVLPDKRGLYKVGYRDWTTPPAHAGSRRIKPATEGLKIKELHQLITTAYGNNGAVAFAWMVAGWFVNQVKAHTNFFPMASFHGDPGSGKSALTVILNAMQGRDEEGLPLSQLNTKKALARSISRVSGMFTACLEDNQRNERAFDYSIVLTGYNQNPLSLKATFSNDNRTTETPFLGSLLFVQNTEPFNQKAEKERVVSLAFDHSVLTDQTYEAYEKLSRVPLPQLARVILLTLQQRKVFENGWVDAYHKALDDLEAIHNRRIRQNHALILAFHYLFCSIFKIHYNLHEYLIEIARDKEISSSVKDYTQASYFFEQVNELPEDKTGPYLHCCIENRRIFLNLTGIEQLLRNKGLQFSVNEHLTKSLTQHPAYIRHSLKHRYPADPNVDSEGRKKQRKSWVFDANKFE